MQEFPPDALDLKSFMPQIFVKSSLKPASVQSSPVEVLDHENHTCSAFPKAAVKLHMLAGRST